jgi:hypothetical protein
VWRLQLFNVKNNLVSFKEDRKRRATDRRKKEEAKLAPSQQSL